MPLSSFFRSPLQTRPSPFPDFKDIKSSLPTGQLPILEIESNGKKKVVGQSAAILRYAGKLGGLYPTDDREAMEVDMLCDHIEDLTKGVGLTVQGSVNNFISDTLHGPRRKSWPCDHACYMLTNRAASRVHI